MVKEDFFWNNQIIPFFQIQSNRKRKDAKLMEEQQAKNHKKRLVINYV